MDGRAGWQIQRAPPSSNRGEILDEMGRRRRSPQIILRLIIISSITIIGSHRSSAARRRRRLLSSSRYLIGSGEKEGERSIRGAPHTALRAEITAVIQVMHHWARGEQKQKREDECLVILP